MSTIDVEQYRAELTGYCYRMLGSAFDADDAVQDTMLRAWQAQDGFEGRSSVRSWVYRIATNVCLDRLRGQKRRAMPMDLTDPVPSHTQPGAPLPEQTWIQPMADGVIASAEDDPATRVVMRDSVRLAFVAALQHLPPRQRAVLILREVLAWPAADVADLLGTTVASVNSALQRARAGIAEADVQNCAEPLNDDDRTLLDRYLVAFENYDMESLIPLLREDATMSMPPLALWLRGREEMRGWYLGHGIVCKGSRLVPVGMNSSPAYACYHPAPGGGWEPWCIQVLELSGGRISHIHHFLDTTLFKRFGLADHLD